MNTLVCQNCLMVPRLVLYALATALALVAEIDVDGSPAQPYDGSPCADGACKPSYLIIGVGKCGTSSLYYYLAEHPSVRPAAQKQLQWFDHQWSTKREAWARYLASFPARLEPGEMTGEASPGYVAYSEVPPRVFSKLPQARILVVVRDPASRAFSSYNYNYVSLANAHALPFTDIVRAEIRFLQRCISDFAARAGGADEPIDFSRDCFRNGKDAYFQMSLTEETKHVAAGGLTSRSAARHPAIPRANEHLWRQMVARSTYAPYLEHWYRQFPASAIRVVCLEADLDVQSAAGEAAGEAANGASGEAALERGGRRVAAAVGEIAHFLGLAPFDFTSTVAKGRYNAGGHKAHYEHATKWALEGQTTTEAADLRSATAIPAEGRRLIGDFTRPFNERLFELSGRRCARWDSDTRPP